MSALSSLLAHGELGNSFGIDENQGIKRLSVILTLWLGFPKCNRRGLCFGPQVF